MKRTINIVVSAAARLLSSRVIVNTLSCVGLLLAANQTVIATTRTWTNAFGDNMLLTGSNWSPNGTPQAGASDVLVWDGTAPGNLILTNNQSGSFNNLDNNPGVFMSLTASQTGSLTLVENVLGTGRIRLNASINIAAGAGALTFGGNGVALPIALGVGNSASHFFTNNSANPVTFTSDVYYVMGGGGTHIVNLYGSGDWRQDSVFQAQNSGSGTAFVVNGAGSLTLVGTPAPGVGYAGTYGNVTVNAGKLILAGTSALGSGNTLIMNGGSLDSTVASLVNVNNNAQSWNGNFTFIGTQSLDLGTGAVSMNANRIVTISANTLTVGGVIGGSGFSLTKAGAGTLLLNGANTYSGGTIVSNGVLQIGNAAALPGGSAAAASVTVYGTLDINGNSPSISSLRGTGIVDSTAAAGAPTLTVGTNDANGAFAGSIQNTAGTLTLAKIGLGTLGLGGASTYSGGTTVSAGTLVVSNSTGSATGSGAVTVSAGATLGGSGIIQGNVDWQASSAALFTLTPTTAVSGSNSTQLTVNGTLTLNGNAVSINLPGGTLEPGTYTLMTCSSASGSFASTPTFTPAQFGIVPKITISGGQVVLTVTQGGLDATWINDADQNWSTPANWSTNPKVPGGAGDAARLGVSTSFRTVTLNTNVSLGAMFFTNANSFVVANAGSILTFDNSSNGIATVSVIAGASNAISAAVVLNTNLTIAPSAGTALSLTNTISNGGSGAQILNVNGAGTVALSGNNSYGPAAGTTGTTLAGGGILQLAHNSALGAGDLSMGGNGTIRATVPLTIANNINGSAGIATVDDSGNSVSLPGVVSGTIALRKNGAGTVTLSSSNSYTGDTTINGGTVVLANAAGIPAGVGFGNLTMNANTLLDLNGNNVVLNGLNSPTNTATVESVAGGTVTLTLGANNAFASFAGSIKNTTGSLSLVKDGTGTQSLAGANTYSGSTTINSGTLQIGNGGTTGSLGTGPLLNNGTLAFNLTGTNIYAGQITGTGAVALANSALVLRLNGNNTFTGPVNITYGGGGALWFTNASALGIGPKLVLCNSGNNSLHLDGSSGNINVDSSIEFQLSNAGGVLYNEAGSNTISGPINMVNGNGNAYVVANSGFLTLAGQASTTPGNNPRTLILGGVANGLLAGNLVDSGTIVASLTKQDAGTWTSTGDNNTFTGPTTVNGGTLLFNGTYTGTGVKTVNAGGTLLINGYDFGSGNVTVNTNGAFGGTGIVGPSVTWQLGAKGSFTTAASLSTPLQVSGSVTLNNNPVTVFVAGGTPLPPGQYPLLYASSISGAFATTPTLSGAGAQAGTIFFVTTSGIQAQLIVANSSVWTNDASGNWTTGANWSSNPNFPNAAGQVATFGVASSMVTVNLDASETVGTVSFTNANSFVITNKANTLTLFNNNFGSTLSVSAGASNAIASGLTLGEPTTFNAVAGTALSIPGNLDGASALTVTGNGLLGLSGSNNLSGGIVLSGGTLALGSTNALGTGGLSIGAGTRLDSSMPGLVNANANPQSWNGNFTFLGSQNLNLGAGAVALGNNLTLTINSNQLSVGGPISGAFTLTVQGSTNNNNSTLELSGANDFTGLTLISGTVALGSDSALGSAATVQFSPAAITPAATNLTIRSKDSATRTITNAVSVNAFDGPYILGAPGTGDLIFSGNIVSGNGYKRFYVISKTTFSGLVTDNAAPNAPVAKDGPGTLVLSGANTLTKEFRLDAGTLALGSTTAIGSGRLTINGGALDSTVVDLANANNNPLTWNADFGFTGTENLNLGTGPVTMNTNCTLTISAKTLTIGGNISGGNYTLAKAGAGTLVLNGANTNGNTTVIAGTLEIAQATLATNSTVAISNSAVLQLNFSTTNRVAALVLGGVSQPNGIYTSSTPGGYLAGPGALEVVAIGPSGPVQLVNSLVGNQLSLSWPTGQGWRLQMQTNSLNVGLSNNWFYLTDGNASSTNITVDPTKPAVFYRLAYP